MIYGNASENFATAQCEAPPVFMDRPCRSYGRSPRIIVMARTGLRVGTLPGLVIRGERYTTVSKGKEQAGTIPRLHEAGRCPSESLMSNSP